MTPAVVSSISERYIELFERITGERFERDNSDDIALRIESNILNWLNGK